MPYQPIEDYGIIGDMHSAALVGRDGSIDWLCVPHFDSPSVFARLLDHGKGGFFRIAPRGDGPRGRQLYWPETNVLITRFMTDEGAAELKDLMPVGEDAGPCRQVIRRVTGVRGQADLELVCRPAFNYARDGHELRIFDGGAEFTSATASLVLATSVPLREDGQGGVRADLALAEGQSAVFALRHVVEDDDTCHTCLSDEQADRLFRHTVRYWRDWISRCTYTGRWREMVHRSALALKLLTFEPTGAIIAAPTCSLPEGIGGERNWDYRYTWIRDAAFTMYALLRLGFKDEAHNYMEFLSHTCTEGSNTDQPLQIMYGIDGRTDLTEQTLDHLDGYRGSRPVRIGNGAAGQLQLDIYGELLDAAYLYNKWGQLISSDLWLRLRGFVDWVCDNWKRQDHGIWEVRGELRDFVSSRLMCWVAVDRGIRLAEKRSFPADSARWLKVRDEIYADILANGYNKDVGAFVQSYGRDTLDASSLLMPLVLFMSPTDPKMLATLDATLKLPAQGGLVSNGMVFRYNVQHVHDGLAGEEGTFNICTFWLAEALARAGRFDRARLEEARLIFEGMLGFSNHLGLYAEQTGHAGEALGNFPQGFTHLALISAAFNLDRALGTGGS